MLVSKIFYGNFGGDTADDKLNEWFKENLDIEILNFQYTQAIDGDHSICIVYQKL